MYATLAQFLRMKPEDQRRVTTLDLSIVTDDDFHASIDTAAREGYLLGAQEEERRDTYGKDSQ